MHVEFSSAARCWTWRCIYGHYGFDYESEWEASQAFGTHACDRSA